MNAIIRPSRSAWVEISTIDFPAEARPYSASGVSDLLRSIREIGLQTPIVVVEHEGRYRLVAGRHRLEAFRVLGQEKIPARVVELDAIEARLWTISENLHRTELTALQRAEAVAEFAKLTAEKLANEQEVVSAQLAPKPQGGRPESGDRLVARKLGIPRDEVRRSQAIAALSVEVKAKAIDLGLDSNQSALLAAAKAPTPPAQTASLERRAERAPEVQAPPKPLRNFEYLAAGELARWIKQTTPHDRPRVIRLLRDCAALLEDELEAAQAA
jgi:ParB-like chromosome segregation protein Spo0J